MTVGKYGFKDTSKHSFNDSNARSSVGSIGEQKLRDGGFSIMRLDERDGLSYIHEVSLVDNSL